MIQADTIVYEKSGVDACLAVLDGGQLREFEVFNENGAAEGNVYLGRIVKKVSLADDKTGFMVNVGDDKEAFMNARHIPAAATAQTSVDIIWLWKIAAAPNASNGHRSLSPAITSHSPHAKSGRNAMASASPIALRVYISVSRYIASV